MECFDRAEENACYFIVSAAILAAGILLAAMYAGILDPEIPLPGCYLYKLTGCYCPGCGGTRAVRALLHLQIGRSILYHPLVVYTAVVCGWFWIRKTAALISGGRLRGMALRPFYLYLALGILIIQWIIKNALAYLIGYQIV